MNELWVFLLVFIALYAIKTTTIDGFENENDPNPLICKDGETFTKLLPNKERVTMSCEQYKRQRQHMVRESSQEWIRSGITQETIYDYDNLEPNNRTCDYKLGSMGPDYLTNDKPGNRKDFYRAPIQENAHLDHETLAVRSRDVKRQSATELFSLKITDLTDYMLPREPTLSEFLDVQHMTDQYDSIYETNPNPDPLSNNQNLQRSVDHGLFWRKSIGQDADPKFKPCLRSQAHLQDNFKVVRPDQSPRRTDTDNDTKVKANESSSLTEDLPCTEPSLPWVQDPHLQDGLNRPYCQKQDVPCATCGTFRGPPMYEGSIYGPNRFPIKQMSDPVHAHEDSEDLIPTDGTGTVA